MASESLKPALLLGSSASLGEAVADQGVGAVVSNTLNSIVQEPEMAAGGLAFGLLTGQGWLSGRAANVRLAVGDEVAGLKIQRILGGSSGKIALIGRSMGNSKMPGVRNAYYELLERGFNVEIFNAPALEGSMLKR